MTGADACGRRLVGRTGELAVVSRLLAGAAEGRTGALLVSGEAGVGKTAVVQEAVRPVGDAFGVLWASCLPLTSLAVPFLPLASAIREWQAAYGGGIPALDPLAFDAWLEEACRARPVVLVVDDLQWADQSTLDVLLYAIALPPRRRFAIVLTLRSGEVAAGHALHRWLAEARRLPGFAEIPLDRLDRAATAEQLADLLGRPPRQALVDDVYGRTRGNAYLTVLLARGLDPDADTVPAGLPSDLREAVSRAWHGLSAQGRDLTRLVAVAGRPAPVDLMDQLAVATGLECDVVDVLRECVERGVVHYTPDERYWFVHPLLAEVLDQGMLPQDRRSRHRAFAAALEARLKHDPEPGADDVIEVADHHHEAGERDAAFRWALRGAEAAERTGGGTECLRLLRRALDLLPSLPPAEVSRRELLTRIREAAERVGDQQEDLRAVDDLLAVVDRAYEPLVAAELLTRRAQLRHWTGVEFAELDGLREAVDLSAGQPGSPEHALALAELAHAEMWHGVASGPGRARAAARLARRTGSTRALAYALATEVMAVCFEGGTDAAQALQAQEAAVQARDFWAYVHAVLWGISSRGTLEDRAVLAFVAESRAELAAVGAPHSYIAVLAAAEAEGNLARGDWRRCAELLRLAFVANPGPLAGATVRLTAAVLACRRGRLAEGWAHLDRAEELPANPRTFALCDFLFARATLAAAAGDADAAVDAAVAGVELPVRPDGVERLLPVAAQALADAAERLRDRGHDPAEPVGRLNHLRRRFPTIVVDVLPGEVYRLVVAAMQSLYDAEAARGRGDAGAAQAWLRATVAARTAELLWEEAYASWRVAEALLPDRAQRVEGMAALRRAYEIASDLDANPIVTEVEALAREARVELGAPTALPAAAGARSGALAALTARERELLTHVVAGRTYREIARALQISEKTVSSHVSTILAKTGTANRVALAQLVRRLDAANERP